jgi:hypothetical protein
MREYIISEIRDSKRWQDAVDYMADDDNPMPRLEELSNSDLLDEYNFWCNGFRP